MATRTDHNTFEDGKGVVLREAVVQVDTTIETNTATLAQRAQAALTANAAYIALASPTAAQTTAQVQRLTKECSAIIRQMYGLLADISDTA